MATSKVLARGWNQTLPVLLHQVSHTDVPYCLTSFYNSVFIKDFARHFGSSLKNLLSIIIIMLIVGDGGGGGDDDGGGDGSGDDNGGDGDGGGGDVDRDISGDVVLLVMVVLW